MENEGRYFNAIRDMILIYWMLYGYNMSDEGTVNHMVNLHY